CRAFKRFNFRGSECVVWGALFARPPERLTNLTRLSGAVNPFFQSFLKVFCCLAPKLPQGKAFSPKTFLIFS
ncbi:MAG: hypothetical protein R6U67_01525, partial [Sodalinema sp.]|uniref:hypothetical protein n=1 Tax=Sodalinema sp. TaxID=3080550 RepID=UPI00396F7100